MSTSPNWSLFAAALAVAILFMLVAARASERLLLGTEEPATTGPEGVLDDNDGDTVRTTGSTTEPTPRSTASREPHDEPTGESRLATESPERQAGAGITALSTEELLLNAGLSQALLGAVVVAAVWFARVPLDALGVAGLTGPTLASGIGLGLGLAAANEVTAGLAARLGIDHDERLRELLAPASIRGWAVLLVIVLPLVAGVEELIFRGAVVGALSVGFGLSPWGLAVVSSVLFGLGHTAQGRGGVTVTAGLGFVLAAAFILTGSLVVVIVAHYLVNALEFVVHEGFGAEFG